MIKLFASAWIEAPAETVWARLAKLEDIQVWSEPVLQARCEGDVLQGVGAERVCDLAGNVTIREHWVAWEEGHSFTYEGFGLPMMKRAVNHWSVIPKGEKTLLTSEAELELKGGVFAKILEPIIGPLIHKMASNALAPFKYFVENGRPYNGKSSELPIAPVIC
jgi:carbon monoxide dehydrogenase subunit G